MKRPDTRGRASDDVARAEAEHAAAVASLAMAERALSAASAAYTASLGQDRAAALAARRAQSDAEVDRDMACHAVNRLAAQVEVARQAAADAEVVRLTAEAIEAAGRLEVAAVRDLKAMGIAGRGLMRLWAEAHLAHVAAVEAGAPASELPEVEGFRNVPDLPRQILETKRVTRWVHPRTGDGLSDEQTARVRVQEGGAYLPGGSQPMHLDPQAEFDRIVFLEPQRRARFVSLIEALAVPGVMVDDPPGWSFDDVASPHAVLARLNELEDALPPDRTDRRERQIELRRVPASVKGACN